MSDLQTQVFQYRPSPTLARFHGDSMNLVRGIMGPFGSGKSTACVMEILYRAFRQKPHRGVRYTRWVVIRNTYPELRTTTLATWTTWLPESKYPITWSPNINTTIRMALPDGTTVHCEVHFVSMDKPKDIQKALGLEVTGAWLNEARELPKAVVDSLTGRVGRYPSKAYGGPTWYGIIMDTNPPDNDHWWYRVFEEECPQDWALYKQPGGLIANADGTYRPNPDAENIENLVGGHLYYLRQVAGKDREWIKVYLCGQYGAIFTGKPVYLDVYQDSVHVSPLPLGFYRGLPLMAGWDFGNTPACVVGQLIPTGAMHILREFQCERGGIHQLATEAVIPCLNNEFRGMMVIGTGDPAGKSPSQHNSDYDCFSELERLGLRVSPARTNDFVPRRDAVLWYLTQMRGKKPALQIDPGCRIIRKGFQGGYHYSRVQIVGEERYKDIPNKNEYSHLHDAVQYMCMGARTPVTSPSSPPAPAQRGGWAAYR